MRGSAKGGDQAFTALIKLVCTLDVQRGSDVDGSETISVHRLKLGSGCKQRVNTANVPSLAADVARKPNVSQWMLVIQMVPSSSSSYLSLFGFFDDGSSPTKTSLADVDISTTRLAALLALTSS